MPSRYHFDERYQEVTALRDGTRVLLRVARPSDRELLQRGFQRLSTESRYLRFMGSKAGLTDAELEALTDLDGETRFAIGAVRWDAGEEEGEGEGLGVARFVRRPEQPEVAEAAVTVVDAVQGRGLGSLLLRRLAAAARERGVRRFQGEVLLRNEPMRRLLAQHAEATVIETDDDVIRVAVDLPSFSTLLAGSADRSDLLGRMLAEAAGGGLSMRLGHLLLKRN